MPHTVTAQVGALKGNAVGRDVHGEDNAIVLARRDLREAIDETGWKHDALAASMSAASGLRIDPPYLSKLLSGEKTLTQAHICALPNDVEAAYEKRRAEAFGLIVVAPLQGQEAVKALVGGLVGVLTAPQLPEKASGMARASIAEAADRKSGIR